MIWIFITLLPTLFEVWQDRNGETSKDKVKDALWLVVGSLTIAWVSHYFGQNMMAVLMLIVVWRIAVFDYLVTYVLYKRRVIESPEAKKWWSYTGKTSKIDQLLSKIDWRWRLGVRIVFLILSVYVYHQQNS
jgi:hypothetical protein